MDVIDKYLSEAKSRGDYKKYYDEVYKLCEEIPKNLRNSYNRWKRGDEGAHIKEIKSIVKDLKFLRDYTRGLSLKI